MECSEPCREFCQWIEALPHHKRFVLKKEDYPMLPKCFKETFLGEHIAESIRQFRGPAGSHVYEFEDRWVLHRDIIDADKDPLGHLLADAPEYIVSALAGLATGLIAKKQKNSIDHLLVGWSMAAFMLLLGKMSKTIGEDEKEYEANAPRLF